MLGYSHKYIVCVTNDHCSDDEEYEVVHGFSNIDDALKFIDSIDIQTGISIFLYEHKLGISY